MKRKYKQMIKKVMQAQITRLKEQLNRERDDVIWDLVHPQVRRFAKIGFDSELYADAVSACMREVNTVLKNYVRNRTGEEYDGATLIDRAFSIHNPIISFGDLTTDSGRNIQVGYMEIFKGAMIGIRNPKAHENLNPDKNKTRHLLFIASFMFLKLEEAGVPIGLNGSSSPR